MQIFLFNAGIDSNQLNDLERRIRVKLPDLQLVSRMEEINKALPKNGEATARLPASCSPSC